MLGRTNPNSHLGSNPEATLREYAIVVWTKPVIKQLPRPVRRVLVRPESLG